MTKVSGEEAKRLVQDGATLVDVRTPPEFALGHLDGAVNVPVQDLAVRHAELDPARAVVVYCRSGARSAAAAELLSANGFNSVHDLGPKSAWDGGSRARWLLLPLGLSLTLGLAPFTPEPHVLGKLRWVAGGADGMGLMDWFDLGMHGGPWLWLAFALVSLVLGRQSR